jgi:hypothetical protein
MQYLRNGLNNGINLIVRFCLSGHPTPLAEDCSLRSQLTSKGLDLTGHANTSTACQLLVSRYIDKKSSKRSLRGPELRCVSVTLLQQEFPESMFQPLKSYDN